MAERVSAAQRVKLQNVAEREVMRYAGDHALWHKYVHNVDLDPAQVLKMIEMDEHPKTIDYSCRRTGKTAVKELWDLEHLACNADQELGIVAPRAAQSEVCLRYHTDATRRSEILENHLAFKDGRKQRSDTYYQFANKSIARSYGIMSQVDGGDLTLASLEEVDDMPKDRLYNNFLLMLGSNRRLGADSSNIKDPIIRITGVFKGADTLSEMVDSGQYKVLTVVHAYLGMKMGIINEKFIKEMKHELSPDEYIRQLLCRNVSARNLIWEKYIRKAMTVGLKAGIELASPLPGMHYQKRGLIGLGYDHSGHGENPQASKYAVVITEQIGNFCCVIYARTWAPGTDEKVVENDLVELWRYFNVDYAMGDAFGVGLITSVNNKLYDAGLINTDIRTIGDGQSTATTWKEWAFAPIRFEGMTKHIMATAVQKTFHNGLAAIPYFDDQDMNDPETAALRSLVRQLGNMRAEKSGATYNTYKMVNPKLGDDLFDAAMASVWALGSRGASPSITDIVVQTKTPDQLLQSHGSILPQMINAYMWLTWLHNTAKLKRAH